MVEEDAAPKYLGFNTQILNVTNCPVGRDNWCILIPKMGKNTAKFLAGNLHSLSQNLTKEPQ